MKKSTRSVRRGETLKNEEAAELMIRIGMPVATSGLVLTQTLLSIIFIMDKYIFNREMGNPAILVVGFGLNVLGIVYCFRYSKNVLGYFDDLKKKGNT